MMHLAVLAGLVAAFPVRDDGDPWVVYPGGTGPGQGKHIVLVSGDEEYRSEETLTQLGRILAKHHGFKCTVLYAIDVNDDTINPNQTNNIPGLAALASADLMVIFTRYRDLPDFQMKHVVDYVESGKPIIGLRTATHAFQMPKTKTYARYADNSTVPGWEGGFGRQVLGEKWISHHGHHGKEGTRGLLAKGQEGHSILRGIKDGDIFGTSDVYGVRLPLPGDSQPLVMGEVTESFDPQSKPVAGKKNDPMMPVAWTKSYTPAGGKATRVFTTTMGASQDFASVGLRRLLVNASYWAVGLEKEIPAAANVDVVGFFQPSPFKSNGFKKGVKPANLLLR